MSSSSSSKKVKLPQGGKDLNKQKKKVAIVTGSQRGIGYGIVKVLCEKFDGDVYLTALNEKEGLAAIKSLNDLGYQPKFHLLDMTVPESVKKLRDHIVEHYGGLDILINNAGIGSIHVKYLEPAERRAYEIMRVDYYGFRDTCDILFPILKPHARVVNITSCLGHLSYISSERVRKILAAPDLTVEQTDSLVEDYIKAVRNGNEVEQGWSLSPYYVAKALTCALSRIQQREFLKDKNRPDIVVNYVYPGPVDTDMIKQFDYKKLTLEQGAQVPVWLALLPENCTKPKGDFVWYSKEIVDWVNGPMPPWEVEKNPEIL